MRVRWHHLIVAALAAPILAVLVAWSGVLGVGATGGHWRITEWFLHFAMRSSIRTHSLTVEKRPLPEEGVQAAAGHYLRGCAICHGAPGEPRSPAALAMLPQPPFLPRVVGSWTDEELFRIVQHGVRYTGMPAWPSVGRDDEIWAMVAFLRRLPEISREQYRELAYGAEIAIPAAPAVDPALEARVADCARCHGSDGLGRSPLVPALAGQSETYLAESLEAYVRQRRPSGIMEMALAGTDATMRQRLAAHFSSLPARRPAALSGSGDSGRGKEIAERGIPGRAVPACLGCHGEQRRNPTYPVLDGQPGPYLLNQLRLFASGERGGTRYAHLMERVASRLRPEEMEALADYFAGRPAASRQQQAGAETEETEPR